MIQNTTFGGIRGFTARPSTPFSDADGNFAGIVHQERNVTYALFSGAGNKVPMNKPKAVRSFPQSSILPLIRARHTNYLKSLFWETTRLGL